MAALEAELGELQAERSRVAALKQRLDKALAELESERKELKQSRVHCLYIHHAWHSQCQVAIANPSRTS